MREKARNMGMMEPGARTLCDDDNKVLTSKRSC
jgi:hypothetical protein